MSYFYVYDKIVIENQKITNTKIKGIFT